MVFQHKFKGYEGYENYTYYKSCYGNCISYVDYVGYKNHIRFES